jgi:hypothetical protein
MFTEVRVDDKRGGPRFMVHGPAWEALRSCTAQSGFLTGSIESGEPPVVQVKGLLETLTEPAGQPVIGVYRVVGSGIQSRPESHSAVWTRPSEPHVRLLVHRTPTRTIGTFWFDDKRAQSVVEGAGNPFWQRHRLAFVAATAVPVLSAIFLAASTSVQTSSPRVIEWGRRASITGIAGNSPAPIVTAPADFRPRPGQAVLIPAVKDERSAVKVRVTVDPKGRVIGARLVGGEAVSPHVAEAVLKTARQSVYPASPLNTNQEFEVSFLIAPDRNN